MQPLLTYLMLKGFTLLCKSFDFDMLSLEVGSLEDGGQHGAVEGAAAADDLGGVQGAAGVLVEEVLEDADDGGHPGGSPGHLHRRDVLQANLGVLQRLQRMHCRIE